jgi:16S rRNA (cytidine1402-2'-O)-methyltransferase
MATVARELTKLFEENRRGTLAELVEFYSTRDVKGEITLVIGPPGEDEAPMHDLDALLNEHMKKVSLRDAVAAVSAITGVKRGEVYTHALNLAGKDKKIK